MIHKKCHKLIRVGCDVRAVTELLEHNEEKDAHRSHGSGSWSRPGNGATGHSESMGKIQIHSLIRGVLIQSCPAGAKKIHQLCILSSTIQ